jgi:hypothetical protein
VVDIAQRLGMPVTRRHDAPPEPRRDAVTAPALADATRVASSDVPATRRGATPDRRDATRRAPARRVTRVVARPVRAATRGVELVATRRGALSTISSARNLKRLGVRPTDSLFVYRIRRLNAWLSSPAGMVALAVLLAAGAWVALQHPEWTEALTWIGLAVLSLLAGWIGWGAADGMILWPHRAQRVNEMGYALRPILDISPDIPAAKFVRWPRDFGEADTEMRIVLTRGYVGTDDERKQLVHAVHEIGGFEPGDLNHQFVLRGPSSYLQVTPREKLIIPKLVRADDPEIIEMLEAVRPGRPLLAIGGGGTQIFGDLGGEAPHMGFSMRTGGGKSNQLKGVIAQEMHAGASVVILDLKRRSLKCFKGLEGVLYCRDIEEIHSALITLYKEADNRNRLADDLGDDEEPPWQRRLIVMEEQNSTTDELTDYWLQVREPSDPRVSPAVRALRKLLNMGRGVDENILSVFQKITAQAAGGTVARDQFGMVVMSKFRPSTWKMVADEIPMPNIAGKPRGRCWYVCDGEAPEGQSLLWTDAAARAWASSGKSSAVRAYDPRTRGAQQPAYQGERPANVAGTGPGIPAIDVTPATVMEPDPERLFTLSEASSDKGRGIVQATYHTLRGRRAGSGRDPEFPPPDALDGQRKLYRAETLRRWESNREVTV